MTVLPTATRNVGPLVALVLAFAAVLGIGLLVEPAAGGGLDWSTVRTDGLDGRTLRGQVIGYDQNGRQLCVDLPAHVRIAEGSGWFRLPEAETETYCIRPPAGATGTLVIPLEQT